MNTSGRTEVYSAIRDNELKVDLSKLTLGKINEKLDATRSAKLLHSTGAGPT